VTKVLGFAMGQSFCNAQAMKIGVPYYSVIHKEEGKRHVKLTTVSVIHFLDI